MTSKSEIIQYVPFMSFVHPSFWHTLTEVKLEVDKLNETVKQINGRFTYREDIGTVFEVDGTSFNKSPDLEQLYQNVTGTIMNKNTIEEFKNTDKAALLNSVGEAMWTNIKTKIWITKPSVLSNFIVISFADLKKFHYYYWFAYPAPSQPTVYLKEPSSSITTHFNNKQLENLAQAYKSFDLLQKNFFIILKENDDIALRTLAEVLDPKLPVQNELCVDLSNAYFVFADPSNTSNPGWPMRLFLAALLEHCPFLTKNDIKVIGLRCHVNGAVDRSLVFTVTAPENVQATESAGWVGWERNDRGNFGPKLANMSASMDPIKLAEESSDLNIKLMKWRLVPDIDVEVMKTTRCLLLGAGTLGCHVARDLLAWGFRHITFVDNGKVSYSNPTRQVLYTHADCAEGRPKAQAAADNLRLILPTVKSEGFALHIPMPGHPVGESLRPEAEAGVARLRELIASHDAVFLLLDTREARWLPTLIAAHYGKIVINAALGFDSYLVMRHGAPSAAAAPNAPATANAYLPGAALGCYFCNDVTAPGNSLKDRTLDQQCTVTRPGVAAIAGALAVEILVGLLQHPLRIHAPALCNLSEDTQNIPADLQGVLGPIPHSIRGFLHSYQSVAPTCAKFKQCIACSDTVIDKYRKEGVEFVFKVLNSGSYLEEVTGLSELQLTAEMTDILTFSDEDDDED
ncbi:ubiquitin-like modifier-activating enzyme ATG7 [Choristoneura fumiferana]|uniref:ubiquitin-like modifier-activating enzyme ATG7 n=1 Tax=Choristoneura fumiferana TaxID=7141 RepID=UPI003D156FE3